MPFKQIEYLVEVVDSGSFNRAAQSLYISQQSLRASITSLEEKLGFPVLQRSRNGVQLTQQGEMVIDDMRQVVEMAKRWRQLTDKPTQGRSIVRVAATPGAYLTVMTDVALICQRTYPDISLRLFEYREKTMLATLARSRMIGLLASVPVPNVNDKIRAFALENSYEMEQLRMEQLEVMFNANHPLREKAELELEDLKQFTLVAYPLEDRYFSYKQVYSHFKQTTPIYLGRLENICQILAKEQDIGGIFPCIIKENNPNFPKDKIISRPIRDFPMPGISCLLYPSGTALTPDEQIVLDIIRTEFGKLKQL